MKLLLKLLQEEIDYRLKHWWTDYFDDEGHIVIDEDAILNWVLDSWQEQEGFSDAEREHMYAQLEEVSPIFFMSMRIRLLELAEEFTEYEEAKRRGMSGLLAYHGLSQNDFI